jgi:glucose-6-phosphate 1-dehydrogenase
MATMKAKASPEDGKGSREQLHVPDPTVVVIFGASGDLTKRKLLPALFHLEEAGLLPAEFAVVGVARRALGDEFAAQMKEGIVEFGAANPPDPKLQNFLERVHYHAMNFDDEAGYTGLEELLKKIDRERGTEGNRLFYLATAPEHFSLIIERLGAHHLAQPAHGTVRLVIEKPFGHDLASARALNKDVNRVFREDQTFRIDHYLGKETVQNILVFRFANGIFEPIWNRNYIDHVQITAAEAIGIEGRGPFYEQAGALRDVVQNHMMELLSFVAMEPPISFEADTMRRERVKVWRAIQPVHLFDTVRGQYGRGTVAGKTLRGYREEERVDPLSMTETFAAFKLVIENWRWAGVPFYLRAGKRMARQLTEITIQFKEPPHLLFGNQGAGCSKLQPNLIAMRIQPDEGISLRFSAKVPSPNMEVCPVVMDFNYAEAFGKSSANGYERLLLDAMLGDSTLFAHRDGVEATWALITPILEQWAAQKPKDFPNYAVGSWGPKAADDLLARDGRSWRDVAVEKR